MSASTRFTAGADDASSSSKSGDGDAGLKCISDHVVPSGVTIEDGHGEQEEDEDELCVIANSSSSSSSKEEEEDTQVIYEMNDHSQVAGTNGEPSSSVPSSANEFVKATPFHRRPPPPPLPRAASDSGDTSNSNYNAPTIPAIAPTPPPPTALTVPGHAASMMHLMHGLDRVVEKRRQLRASGAVISRFVIRHLGTRIRVKKLRAAVTIQRMWARTKMNFYRKRMHSFTMGGRWSIDTACLVLALVLGARVRWCMRNPTVRAAQASIKQLEAIVSDSSGAASSPAFISTVQKQIHSLKDRFYSVFFDDALFVSFPAPGYFVLCRNRGVACKRLMLVASKVASASPVTHESTSIEMRTPAVVASEPSPQLKTDSNSRRIMGRQLAGSVRQKLRSLGPHIDKRNEENSSSSNYNGTNSSPESQHEAVENSSESSQYPRITARSSSPDSSVLLTSPMPKRHITPTASRTPDASESLLSRPHSKAPKSKPVDRIPHVDIHVISGSKLAPASRSKILRDDSGVPIADRYPTLKVVLCMPKVPASTEMKEVCKLRYDYQERSLNPNWDHLFRLPLPTLESTFTGYSSSSSTDGEESRSLLSESRALLLESTDSLQRQRYDSDLAVHRRWWSAGVVKIEVVDGDRFNDDIFMGEMSIFLSSLLGPRKDVLSEWSSAREYQLLKRNATDRVTGSISVKMKVEIPTFETLCSSAVKETLTPKQVEKGSLLDGRVLKSAIGNTHSDPLFSSVDVSLLGASPEKKSYGTPVLGGKLSARISQMKRRGSDPMTESGEASLIPVVRSSRLIRPRESPSETSNSSESAAMPKAGTDGRTRSSPETIKVHYAEARSRVTQQLQGLEAIISQPTDIMPNYLKKKET